MMMGHNRACFMFMESQGKNLRLPWFRGRILFRKLKLDGNKNVGLV